MEAATANQKEARHRIQIPRRPCLKWKGRKHVKNLSKVPHLQEQPSPTTLSRVASQRFRSHRILSEKRNILHLAITLTISIKMSRKSAMSSTFESSMSTSRQPLGPSLADTLPSINFGFDELRDRMAKFTAKFDAFIEQGRKRVLEERNQFRMNVAELQGTCHPTCWKYY